MKWLLSIFAVLYLWVPPVSAMENKVKELPIHGYCSQGYLFRSHAGIPLHARIGKAHESAVWPDDAAKKEYPFCLSLYDAKKAYVRGKLNTAWIKANQGLEFIHNIEGISDLQRQKAIDEMALLKSYVLLSQRNPQKSVDNLPAVREDMPDSLLFGRAHFYLALGDCGKAKAMFSEAQTLYGQREQGRTYFHYYHQEILDGLNDDCFVVDGADKLLGLPSFLSPNPMMGATARASVSRVLTIHNRRVKFALGKSELCVEGEADVGEKCVFETGALKAQARAHNKQYLEQFRSHLCSDSVKGRSGENAVFTVYGHADQSCPQSAATRWECKDHNLKLSQRRADYMATRLGNMQCDIPEGVSNGINIGQKRTIKAVGVGDTQPLPGKNTGKKEPDNRRVELSPPKIEPLLTECSWQLEMVKPVKKTSSIWEPVVVPSYGDGILHADEKSLYRLNYFGDDRFSHFYAFSLVNSLKAKGSVRYHDLIHINNRERKQPKFDATRPVRLPAGNDVWFQLASSEVADVKREDILIVSSRHPITPLALASSQAKTGDVLGEGYRKVNATLANLLAPYTFKVLSRGTSSNSTSMPMVFSLQEESEVLVKSESQKKQIMAGLQTYINEVIETRPDSRAEQAVTTDDFSVCRFRLRV